MGSLYDMFYGLWSQAFGQQYVTDHADLLALLSTATVIGVFYFTLKLGGKLIKKWTGGKD